MAITDDVLTLADQWHRKGVELLSLGEYAAAYDAYQQAIDIAGEQGVPWSLFDAGKCLFHLGHLDEAGEALQLARDIMPHELWPYIELAKVYYTQGNSNGAIETLKAAIQRPDAHITAGDYVTVGQVFFLFDNLQLARAYFQEALYRDANNAAAAAGLEQVTTREVTPAPSVQETMFSAHDEKKTKQRGRPRKDTTA